MYKEVYGIKDDTARCMATNRLWRGLALAILAPMSFYPVVNYGAYSTLVRMTHHMILLPRNKS